MDRCRGKLPIYLSPFGANCVKQSIIEVVILCVVGYILASTGVLDKQTQRKVNVLSTSSRARVRGSKGLLLILTRNPDVSFATPALLGSKVAFSLTPEKLKEMWVIPLG